MSTTENESVDADHADGDRSQDHRRQQRQRPLHPDPHTETGGATRSLKLTELVRKIGASIYVPHQHDEVDHGHCDLF